MDNLIISLLFGVLGGEVATYLEKKDRKINLPIRLIYLVSFAIIYNVSMIFTGLVYLLKGFPIPWSSIGIFSILISLSISIALFFLKIIKK